MAGYAAELTPVVALLGASIVTVTLFRRLGLGSVLGYLAAGIAVGPFGLALFADPKAVLHLAELGVVMFLFIIGLEMQPSRLWQLRRDIFGLGAAQVATCGSLLTALGYFLFDLPAPVALIAALGFTLSSTAIVFQVLEERGETLTAKASAPCRSCCWKIWRLCRCWRWLRSLPPVPATERASAGSALLLASVQWRC